MIEFSYGGNELAIVLIQTVFMSSGTNVLYPTGSSAMPYKSNLMRSEWS